MSPLEWKYVLDCIPPQNFFREILVARRAHIRMLLGDLFQLLSPREENIKNVFRDQKSIRIPHIIQFFFSYVGPFVIQFESRGSSVVLF